MNVRFQFSRPFAKAGRLSAMAIGGALLFSIGGANIASATPDTLGVDKGTANFTFNTYPGSPTTPNGGGPFGMTITGGTSTPATLGVPLSVQTFCVEISQDISAGSSYTAELYQQAASKLGGLLKDGLQWLNITNTGGTSGNIIFKAGAVTSNSSFGFTSAQTSALTSNWWNDAKAVGAALQQAIWSLQLNTAIPTVIGGHADGAAFVNDLIANAASLSYFWLALPNNQDQIFYVPGPIVGTGLPGLVLVSAALLAFARRRRQIA